MTGGHDQSASMGAIGSALVALQFALLAWLAWLAARALGAGATVPVDALVLGAACGALALWALSANRPGNFNIRPLPRADGQLIQHGPYRWIRHPMYTSLLLGGAAAARLSPGATGWWALLALAIVLAVKANVEEQALLRHHPGYADYRRRTGRFLPRLH